MSELQTGADFDGETYERGQDKKRLTGQLTRVFKTMRDGKWRTLAQIEAATGDPQSSVSARLRDMRKKKFGANTVRRRRRGEGKRGLFEYRLVVTAQATRIPLI